MKEQIDTPWMPEEIKFLYEFKKDITTKTWNPNTAGDFLEAERILTYSKALKPLACNCHAKQRKNRIIDMFKKASKTIDELYQKYCSEEK